SGVLSKIGNSFLDKGLDLIVGSIFPGTGFADGGYTGAGGKYAPAGVVHRGEFVFDAESVRRLGVNNLERIRGFAAGGFVGHAPALPHADNDAASGGVVVNYAPVIHGTGGMSRRELQATLKEDRESFRRELPRMIGDARRRGGM
ncbi:MAG: double-strand break repair rad50 ATPase, partial [Devosia sp.]|nr:double-strand break repair rad50 ATPase [Devosia sp.]